MSMRKQTILRCDRCGMTAKVDDDCFDAVAAARAAGGGWRHVGRDVDLCGECAESYIAIRDRHERELSDFMG